MACCFGTVEHKDPADVSWSDMFMNTFCRDARTFKDLLKTKIQAKKYARNNETIPTLFMKTLRKCPHKPAFVMVGGKTWTFQEVNIYSNRVANYLSKQGFQKGDTVSILMENSPEFVMFWLGLAKIGVVASLINFNLRGSSLLHCIKISGCTGLIYIGVFGEALQEVGDGIPSGVKFYCNGNYNSEEFEAIEIDQELMASSKDNPTPPPESGMQDILFHIYTSGTTGMPKAAIFTHARFHFGATLVFYVMKLRRDMVVYNCLPQYHTAGAVLGVGTTFLFGVTSVIRKKFSASAFWDDCIKHECDAFQYIGEICRYLLAQPEKATDKQHKVSHMIGNGLRPQIWQQFRERFGIQHVREFFGSTEGNCGMMNNTDKVGAVGFATLIAPSIYPVALVKVNEETEELLRDEDGVCIKCKPGEPGHLVGKIVAEDPSRRFDGYLDGQATNERITHSVFEKGDAGFLSGDILMMDGYGYVYFCDRMGDTFRWKGENVSSAEVEAVISNIIQLNDAVVYGVEIPGTEGKAGMAAIVDERDHLDLVKLYAELCKSLPPYAIPRFIRVIQGRHIDLTSTFKLNKTQYRKEGFNPSKVKDDKLFYLDAAHGKYLPLLSSTYSDIQNKQFRF